MEKRPTIKDIAKIAKVSNTAVSMALRGHTRISLETRQKILRIAKRLDYQPNFIARSLVMKKTNTIVRDGIGVRSCNHTIDFMTPPPV
jgi:DNA-binding LacI/PurR family transcriptional regulator